MLLFCHLWHWRGVHPISLNLFFGTISYSFQCFLLLLAWVFSLGFPILLLYLHFLLHRTCPRKPRQSPVTTVDVKGGFWIVLQ
jgi:hypothetical protein